MFKHLLIKKEIILNVFFNNSVSKYTSKTNRTKKKNKSLVIIGDYNTQ